MEFLKETIKILWFFYGYIWIFVVLAYAIEKDSSNKKVNKYIVSFIVITGILATSTIIQIDQAKPKFHTPVASREKTCRYDCKYMLGDLSDTWGVNTNNQDSISKTIMECFYDCMDRDKQQYEN